jgi:hypothetical protein
MPGYQRPQPQPTTTPNPKEEAEKKAAEEARRQQNDNILAGRGFNVSDNLLSNISAYNAGSMFGQREFMDDPEMQRLRGIREDYAKGYDSQELGAIRQTARGEMAGSQQSTQRKLQSNLGRGGVGGARGAAIKGAAAQQGSKDVADAERKMALDSAAMKRQGAADLQDFIFRQKLGKMGTAAGFMQTTSAEKVAENQAKSNSGGGGGMCFITTAACEHFNLSDDCDELTTLRWFRDNIMKTGGWAPDVETYYQLAAELGPKLEAIEDSQFWAQVFEFITKSVSEIKKKHYELAYNTYKQLIEFVKAA